MTDVDPYILPEPRITLDVVIRNLLPERVLRIKAVGVDGCALHLQYEVTPPVPGTGAEGATRDEALRYVWLVFGHDNLGNQYATGGGIQHLAPDGQRTEGVMSLNPAPAAGASWLELAFLSPTDEQPWDHPRHTLRLTLPLESESEPGEAERDR